MYNQTDIGHIFHVKKPFIFTIFGASGDLAKLKIFPALFSLAEQNRLPESYAIIGFARSEKSLETFRQIFADSVKSKVKGDWTERRETVLQKMLTHVHYHRGYYDQVDSFLAYADFRSQLLPDYQQEIFYFSTPPQTFIPIIENLGKTPGKERMKPIIEKPFGTDEKTALELYHVIGENFLEGQVYLLDHYLGKKAVRSILPLRCHNYLLNVILKGHHIRNIQVSALEPFGVEERIGYFDKSGTIRDMIQSHLLQILGLTIMSIPLKKTSDNIHREKNNIIEALECEPSPQTICVGQYQGYCEIDPNQCSPFTPTFAAVKLTLDREEWTNTPIYLRSGKFVGDKKQTYIVIELNKSVHQEPESAANKVIIELSPDEKIHIRLLNDFGDQISAEEMTSSESLACHGDYCLTEHGLLLLDVIRGRKENFISFQEILSCWRLTDKIIDYTASKRPETYDRHSTGPQGQDLLMEGFDFGWHEL